MAENIITNRNIDEFLESAKKLEKIPPNKILDYLDEALPHFNHYVKNGKVVQISDTNCVNVVQNVDEFLKTGKITKTIHSKAQNIFNLEKIYNKSFLTYKIPTLTKIMKEGERGIIFGKRSFPNDGHVFNVIKKDGELLFKDGQNGLNANLRDGFESFKYLKTN